MKIYLRDRNQVLCDRWKSTFNGYDDVHVSCGNIFDPGPHMQADAVVSPANSFGFMDGGIDLVYTKYFGQEMQENLRKCIIQYGGEILVGNALVMGIPNSKNIKYLISAPTMRVPEDVSNTINAYLAFKAALKVAKDLGLNSILCPGLATTTGKMTPNKAVYQMYCAYIDVFYFEQALGQPPLSVYDLRDYAKWHKLMKEFK